MDDNGPAVSAEEKGGREVGGHHREVGWRGGGSWGGHGGVMGGDGDAEWLFEFLCWAQL